MKRRRVVLAALRRLVSLAATVVVSLLVLEMSLRLVHRLGYDSSLPYGMKAPGTSAVRLVPNFEGISRRGIKYQTNTIGFRDDQIDPSAKHVIFLGDSTTFGLNIAHDDTYPEIFEGQLAADGILCQSVNTASPGQGTFDELDTLRGLCSSGTLNVRAVVLGFFQNDLSGNMIYAGLRVSEYPDAFQPIACLRKTRTWITLSELWRAGRDRRAMIRVRERAIAPPLDERREYAKLPGFEVEWDWLSADEIVRNRGYTLTLQAVDAIADLAHSLGVPFVFIYLPSGEEEIRGRFCPKCKDLLLAHVGRRNGVVCLDAAELYRAHLEECGLADLPAGFYSWREDIGHPGPLSCRLVAEELVRVLRDSLAQ